MNNKANNGEDLNLKNHLVVPWQSHLHSISGCILSLQCIRAPDQEDHYSNDLEIMQLLFGLHYNFKQIILSVINQDQVTEYTSLWIEQPADIKHAHFFKTVEKIAQFYSLKSRCYVQIKDDKTVIDQYQSNQHRNMHLDKQIALNEFKSEIWESFVPEKAKITAINVNQAHELLIQPQTNLGKLARDLKLKKLIEQLELVP